MKLMLAALAALLLVAAPASAGVSSQKSGQDPDAVRAYWTDARMKAAKPIMRAKPTKPGTGGGTTGTWSTVAVSWPAADPKVYAHGKVFFSEGSTNYVCSGTAVAARVVWTAGHCVNQGPGAFYTNFMFVPAYNSDGQRPRGTFPATQLHTTTQWRTQANAYGYDLGAATVAANETGKDLATALGGAANLRTLDTSYTRSAANDAATGRKVNSFGYPAASPYTGQTEYVCQSYVSRRDTSATPPDYGIPCSMTGGSSGGGWVDPGTGKVFSVNSYGYSTIRDTMFGPTQGAEAAALLTAAGG
jgi:V8-like Glu-specific endopeptidase